MGGGATMLGAMRALGVPGSLRFPGDCRDSRNRKIMPGAGARKNLAMCKTAMSGKTIEVITNTDAEGRMVLADGVFYARQLGVTHLIDAATLDWRN